MGGYLPLFYFKLYKVDDDDDDDDDDDGDGS